MNGIDSLRAEMLEDLCSDRRAWLLTMVPQLFGVGVLAILLSVISACGLWLAMASLRENVEIQTLVKAGQVFVGGSSSVLGFVVIKLLAKLTELTAEFMTEQKRFTSYIGRLKLAATKTNLAELLQEYCKREVHVVAHPVMAPRAKKPAAPVS